MNKKLIYKGTKNIKLIYFKCLSFYKFTKNIDEMLKNWTAPTLWELAQKNRHIFFWNKITLSSELAKQIVFIGFADFDLNDITRFQAFAGDMHASINFRGVGGGSADTAVRACAVDQNG